MATTEVPVAFKHVCDGCRVEQTTANRSRPPHWSDLILARDAYDFQGAAVADATVKRLLCESCSERVVAAINAAVTAPQSP